MANFVFFFSKINKFSRYNLKGVIPAVPVGAAGEKFSKFDTFSCIFRVKNDKFCVFSLKIEKFSLYK